MPYVIRNANRAIVGLAANHTPGVTDAEPLADDHAEVVAWRNRVDTTPNPNGAYMAILTLGTPEFTLFQRVHAVGSHKQCPPAVGMAYGDFRGALQAESYVPGALSGALMNLHTALNSVTPSVLGIALLGELRAQLMNGGQNAGFTSAERSVIELWNTAYHLNLTMPW